jgi:hypothetical protein
MCTAAIATLTLAGCAEREYQPPPPPPPPVQPQLQGAFRSVSQADVRAILTTTREYMVKQYGAALPIYRVFVINPRQVTVQYWVRRNNTVASLVRVGRRWKVTGIEGERIITRGRNIPTS